MANAYLVVRIKGQADVPYWASTTMTLLKLDKKYRATILPAKENTLGMLKKVMNYISWIELDADLAKEILDKKARKSGYKKITSEDLKAHLLTGVNNIDTIPDNTNYIGKLGLGATDAVLALGEDGKIAPEAITDPLKEFSGASVIKAYESTFSVTSDNLLI